MLTRRLVLAATAYIAADGITHTLKAREIVLPEIETLPTVADVRHACRKATSLDHTRRIIAERFGGLPLRLDYSLPSAGEHKADTVVFTDMIEAREGSPYLGAWIGGWAPTPQTGVPRYVLVLLPSEVYAEPASVSYRGWVMKLDARDRKGLLHDDMLFTADFPGPTPQERIMQHGEQPGFRYALKRTLGVPPRQA